MSFGVGGPVHPTRQIMGVDRALGLPALYAGAKILLDSAASLPIKVYTKGASGVRLTPYTGPTMFDNPSVLGTNYDWIFTCMASMILHGNAWGIIMDRDAYGYPTGIEWVNPDWVIVEEDEAQPFNPLAKRVYVAGRQLSWYGPNAQLFHIKAFPMPQRLEGISLLRAFALTITAGFEAQKYGTSWYEAGGFPTGTFQNSELEVDAEQAAQVSRILVAALRERRPLVYGRDWDYNPVTCPPSEAQFIDAMRLNATHIAAILDLPAVRLAGDPGGSLNYSSPEQNQIQIIESLRPWLVRMERSFSRIIPAKREIKFNTDALLKTDLKTRTEIYQIQRMIGLRTTDELRELEDLPPLPGGAGNEALPLQLMVSMAQRSGALPKSMLDQVVLLIDVAGKKLEQLQKKGITKEPVGGDFSQDPDTGEQVGPANSPGQFYANMLNSYSRELDLMGKAEAARIIREAVLRMQADGTLTDIDGPLMQGKAVKEIIDNLPEVPLDEED